MAGIVIRVHWLLAPRRIVRFAAMDPDLDAVLYFRILNSIGVVVGIGYLVYIAVRYLYPGRPHWTPGRRAIVALIFGMVFGAVIIEFFRD